MGDRYRRDLRSGDRYVPWPGGEAPGVPDDQDTAGTLSRYKTAFQIDKERITNSTAFRRLEYKTQVFVSHEGDHYRTRLTHTIEVSETARLIAQALQLNEDLVEAVALGHDLGHTPIGHVGEETLDALFKKSLRRFRRFGATSCRGAFYHNVQGVRVVDSLEKGYEWDRRNDPFEKDAKRKIEDYDPEDPPEVRGYGMDLTWAVREGILKHTSRGLKAGDTIMFGSRYLLDDLERSKPATLEGQVVEFSDEIASMMHDIEDGIRSRRFSIDYFRKELSAQLKDLDIHTDGGLEEAFGLSSSFFHFTPIGEDDRKKSRRTKMRTIATEILNLGEKCPYGHVVGFLRTLFISNLIEASYTRLQQALTGYSRARDFPDLDVPIDERKVLVIFRSDRNLTNPDGIPYQAWDIDQPYDLRPEAYFIDERGKREDIGLGPTLRVFWISRSTDQGKRQLVTITDGDKKNGFKFRLQNVCVVFEKVKLIGYTRELAMLSSWLRKEFIRDNLHQAPMVIRMGEKGRMWMEKLFEQYMKAPLGLPKSTMPRYGIKITKGSGETQHMVCAKKGRHRFEKDPKSILRIIEHLQGMTDRYLAEEYARLFLDENKMNELEEVTIVDI